jgi:hypothetical protein
MAVAAITPTGAWADGPARSHIGVTAQVAAVTRIESVEQPLSITIRPEDAARGYVTAQATLRVQSNVRDYLLTVWPRAAWFESVQVDGAGTTAELPADGGSIVRRAPGPAVDEVSLELTFRLHEGIREGTYAWPVEFAAHPLQGHL